MRENKLVQMAFPVVQVAFPPRRFPPRRAHSRGLARCRAMSPAERRASVDAASRRILEENWVATPGFTMPNRRKYPWQWLWDSCFHAIAWSHLGDPRGVTELQSLLSLQLPTGFVPHMGYQTHPKRSLASWHAPGRSDITQPPMYGHALRVLAARGFAVEHLYDAATAGLDYLFDARRDPSTGLIRVVHPWETGCDDSPRFDGWHAEPFSERRWNARKRELVRSIRLRDGAAWANEAFDVGSAGFSALVAFNARELGELTSNEDLLSKASALAKAIDGQWLGAQRTWGDVCLAGPRTTSAVRTLDALFAVLVSENAEHVDAAFAQIFDEPPSGARSGPAARPPTSRPTPRAITGAAMRGRRRSISRWLPPSARAAMRRRECWPRSSSSGAWDHASRSAGIRRRAYPWRDPAGLGRAGR